MGGRSERWVGGMLLVCMAVVGLWLVAAQRASRGFEPLRLGQEAFAGFRPVSDVWNARLVYVKSTPTEPTITAYELRPVLGAGAVVAPGGDAPVLVRIVHGYNMVDCMRIKQYGVDLLADNLGEWQEREAGQVAHAGEIPAMQIWRLQPPEGDRRVWISSMLLASDFSATTVDTRSMAFPRVGTPDDAAYRPTGLRWSSLRHPLRNFRLYLRSRWNASRMDLLTFLRLRRPAWASDVMLTMVSEYRGSDASERSEAEMRRHVEAAHGFFYGELLRFGAARSE